MQRQIPVPTGRNKPISITPRRKVVSSPYSPSAKYDARCNASTIVSRSYDSAIRGLVSKASPSEDTCTTGTFPCR
jgi:hypothetical protein